MRSEFGEILADVRDVGDHALTAAPDQREGAPARCIGCGRTESELHADDCSHINGTPPLTYEQGIRDVIRIRCVRVLIEVPKSKESSFTLDDARENNQFLTLVFLRKDERLGQAVSWQPFAPAQPEGV